MKKKVYCNKQDCTRRKTSLADTGAYSRNLCCNTNCELANETTHSEEIISGWVARGQNGDIGLCRIKPKRFYGGWGIEVPQADQAIYLLPSELFPALTWQDEPIEVEVTIKPKK